jgi:peptidoglycan/LPS O-acetylase OafA/YrhL
VLNFLGKISYGIYVYHPLIIFAVLKLLPKFGMVCMYHFLAYAISISLTTLISFLSYNLLEKEFINKKNKYSVIYLGPSNNNENK